MERILGTLTGALRHDMPEPTDEDTRLINALPNPPLIPVTPADIHVRRCRLASDAVDCHFGRFRTEDLPRLLALTQGVSTLIGHRKDEVGVARFFGGTIERLEDVWNGFTRRKETINYIVPKFYWMRSHSEAEDLRVNIDGGIYHQASISWWYEQATCGICGRDMRLCEHVPGKRYDGTQAFYYYDKIGEVLEGSIVFAGGQPFTGFHLNAELQRGLEESRKLFVPKRRKDAERRVNQEQEHVSVPPVIPERVRDASPFDPATIREFPRAMAAKSRNDEQACHVYFTRDVGPGLHGRLVVQPLYSGVPLHIRHEGSTVTLYDRSGETVTEPLTEIREAVRALAQESLALDAVLCLVRGRSRLPRAAALAYVAGSQPDDGRPVLKVTDLWRWGAWEGWHEPFGERWRQLERAFEDTVVIHRVRGALAFTPEDLAQAAAHWASREGIIVRDLDTPARNWKFLKQRELNARVLRKVHAAGTPLYQVGLGSPGRTLELGPVDAGGFTPAVGDIVRVRVTTESIEAPESTSVQIIEMRPDKSDADPALLFRHLQHHVQPAQYVSLQRDGNRTVLVLGGDDDARVFAFTGSAPGPESPGLWHRALEIPAACMDGGTTVWSGVAGTARQGTDGSAIHRVVRPDGMERAYELCARKLATTKGDEWVVALRTTNNN